MTILGFIAIAWTLFLALFAWALCRAAAKPVPPAGGYDEEDDL